MINSLEGQYKHRPWTWEEAQDAHNLACSALTLKRHMNNAGYYKCRACQKSWTSGDQVEKRKVFCTEMLNWPEWKLKLVCWSDECHFHQNSRHTDWVIRNNKERHCPDCMQKRRRTAASQFHVWAMVGWNYKSKLIFYGFTKEVDKQFKNGNTRVQQHKFGGPMNQKRYAAEILPIVEARMRGG